MSEPPRDPAKKKSFADIFKNILKETKKEKEQPKKESPTPDPPPSDVNSSIILKEPNSSNRSEKIIFYEEHKNSVNDETLFDFLIKGGPCHSDLLVACASLRNGSGRGEPVALNCKWFNVTENNELREIEGVTGAFYQPCADDIGTRICVQAIPILGLKEYTGMPIFAEVGPLVIDPEIERVSYENFDRPEVEFNVKIESMALESRAESSLPLVPCEGIIEIRESRFGLWFMDENEAKLELLSCELSAGDYPSIALLKKTNNIFELCFSEREKVKCATRGNKERDIVAISMRLISGRQICTKIETFQAIKEENEIEEGGTAEREKEENSVSPTQNSLILNVSEALEGQKELQEKARRLEVEHSRMKKEKIELLLKLEQLTKDVLRLTKDKETARLENRNLSDSLQGLRRELGETKEKLVNCTKNYYELVEENKHLTRKIELYMNEKLFLFQELDIYKKQIEEIEKLKQIEAPAVPAKPASQGKKRGSSSMKSLSKESLLLKITDLNASILRLEAEVKERASELILKAQQIKEVGFEKEELLNEVNYLRKKNESLAHEKVLNFSPVKQEKVEGPEKVDSEGGKDLALIAEELRLKKMMESRIIDNLEDEVKKLRERVNTQEITIETLKIGLSQEISRKNDKGKSKLGGIFGKKDPGPGKTPTPDFNFLQKLVNVLTETIADKDLALENQKQINKELMKRIEDCSVRAVGVSIDKN